MNSDDAYLTVVEVLGELGIPYMVVGSLSSNFYGVSRSTQDADIVIQSTPSHISEIARRLGKMFRVDTQLRFETATLTRRHVIEVAELEFKIELFYLSDDPHDQERFRRRQQVKLQGRDAFLPTAEDVIITKLRWSATLHRTKDRLDVQDVIAVQKDRIDWDYVNAWCDRHETRAMLDEIRASLAPLP